MNEDNLNPQESTTPNLPDQQTAPEPFAAQQASQPETAPQSPQPAPVPVVTSTTSEPVLATTSATEYNSNPFIATGKGLGCALVNNPVPSILLAIVPFIILLPLFIVFGIIGALAGPIGMAVSGIVIIIALVLILLRATAGTIIVLLDSTNGQKVTTKEAMGERSSKHLTTFFVSGLVSSLMIIAGFLFFIIPGIILLARLSLVPILVYAEGLKTMAAIKRSFALTKGHTFEMLGVITAQSIIGSNGLLSTICGYAGTSRRYIELVELEKSGGPKPKTHWLNFVIPVLAVLGLAAYIGLSALTSSIDTQPNSIYDNDPFYNSDFNSDFNSEFDFNTDFQYDFSE